MPAGLHSGCSATGKFCFGCPQPGLYFLCLKETDGEKRDAVQPVDFGGVYVQILKEVLINRCMFSLKVKKADCNILEVAVVNSIQIGFKIFECVQALFTLQSIKVKNERDKQDSHI